MLPERRAGTEIMVAFDINDRSTWAWREIGPTFVDGAGYAVDPLSAQHFYQATDGGATRLPCPEGTMYNPSVTPGPICDPSAMGEQQINQDTYQWCLDHGVVTEDQR